MLILIVAGLYFSTLFKNLSERIKEFKPSFLNLTITILLLFLGMLSMSGVQSFLYVNF